MLHLLAVDRNQILNKTEQNYGCDPDYEERNFGERAMSQSFRGGLKLVSVGRLTKNENVTKVRDVQKSNLPLIVRMISDICSMSKGSVYRSSGRCKQKCCHKC